MKRTYKYILTVFALCFAFMCYGTTAKAGTVSSVVTSVQQNGDLEISGETGDGVYAVAITVYAKGSDELVTYLTTQVDGKKYRETISLPYGTYEIRVADYDGGVFKTAETVLEAHEHTPVVDPEVPATVEKEGKTAGSHCAVCGTVLVAQKVIPKLEAEAKSYVDSLSKEELATVVNKVSEKVTEVMDDSSSTLSASEKLTNITGSLTVNELSAAMQTDENVRKNLEKLEKEFAAENKIQAMNPEVSAKLNTIIPDASKVKTAGAALNAPANAVVELSIEKAETEEKIDEKKYEKAVQLDISLNINGREVQALNVPVIITMPVPAGLTTEGLLILHYADNGTYETILPKNNADGTITFTVTHFSTFAFVKMVSATATPEVTPPTGGATTTPEVTPPTGAATTTPEVTAPQVTTPQAVTTAISPKTGDTNAVITWLLLMLTGLVISSFALKKRMTK